MQFFEHFMFQERILIKGNLLNLTDEKFHDLKLPFWILFFLQYVHPVQIRVPLVLEYYRVKDTVYMDIGER